MPVPRSLHAPCMGCCTPRICTTPGTAVKVIFDGAGTTWLKTFADPEHKYHDVFRVVNNLGLIAGACEYCAGAFGVTEAVKQAGIPLAGEAGGHPSLAGLVAQGYSPLIL